MSTDQKNYILEQKINTLQEKIIILEQKIDHLHNIIINNSLHNSYIQHLDLDLDLDLNLDPYQYRSLSILKPPKLVRQNAFYYASIDSSNL